MIKKFFLALVISLVLFVRFNNSVYAIEDGAYKVSVNTSYYNPDTEKIDDGGTANAALGEGMCRSATDVEGLIEKSGDEYFVTIRLLLQSDTKDVNFYYRTGFEKYEQVTYDIIAENGMEDSIDYRFKVEDPFNSIKATMHVTPMGRETLWYILLDEDTLNTDTGDFIVSEITSDDTIKTDESDKKDFDTEEISEEQKQNDATQSNKEPETETQEVMKQNKDTQINTNDSKNEDTNNKKNSNTTIYIVSGVLLMGLVVFFRVKGGK
ncbi:hypothetical protein AN1V17_39120 [Vallitalea sediminicola]